MFQTHETSLHVEICTTVSIVNTSTNTCTYKGNDRAIIGLQAGEHADTDHTKHVDEVSNYPEACYMIFANELHANFGM